MIEEASGTRMYENKRVASLKTLEKKQLKMDEIDRILKEDIGPTLAKLKDEMAAYVRWSKSANEQDRTRRLVIAFEYQYFKDQQIKLRDTKAELMKATKEYEVERNSREKDARDVKKQIDDLALAVTTGSHPHVEFFVDLAITARCQHRQYVFANGFVGQDLAKEFHDLFDHGIVPAVLHVAIVGTQVYIVLTASGSKRISL